MMVRTIMTGDRLVPSVPASPSRTGLRVNRALACEGGGDCCADCRASEPALANLSISDPADREEREAKRVAEHALRSVPSTQDAGASELSATWPAVPATQAPSPVRQLLRAPGRRLDERARAFMEPRFGCDFGAVRVHTDAQAARVAADLDARAFTTGSHIAFGEGEYAPTRASGRRLLAHELTHVLQHRTDAPSRTGFAYRQPVATTVTERARVAISRNGGPIVAGGQSPGETASAPARGSNVQGCTSAQSSTLRADHERAMRMISRASDQLAAYDGSDPPEVHAALDRHFSATGPMFAGWVRANLWLMASLARDDPYACFTGGAVESTWACGSPNTLATAFWCVPYVAIRICPPYWNRTEEQRSTTLIHEWVHKYGCNIDVDYEHESEYSDRSTPTQLINADPWANLVRDVQ